MKKPRIRRPDTDNLQLDRISTLPDEVLVHILSFLTTKQAVHTCVLAKRWTNLWASVPVLRLSVCEFQFDGQDAEPNATERRGKLVHKFEQFVNGVLDNRESTSLYLVRYSCHFSGRPHWNPTAWLDRVSLLKPRKIYINIKRFRSLDLPDSIFSCASLVCLKICLNRREKSTISPASINLPSLKYLELRSVNLHDDFTQKLFMGCPSLEFLKLISCNLYCSSISSKTLKKLVIRWCFQLEQMQISCTGLVTLHIASYLRRGISLKSMMSLIHATIAPQNFGNYELPVLNLFDGLTNAVNLFLAVSWPWMKEQLKMEIPNCKNFNNLEKLTIYGMSHDFDLVECLLRHSPKLKELKLYFRKNQDDSHGEPRSEALGDVSFQHEYLETINIYGIDKSKLSAIDELVKVLRIYVKEIAKIRVHQ